jgi:zinc-finger of a C2HC-type
VPALVSVCRAYRAESEAMAYEEQENRRAALLGGRYSGSAAYPPQPSKDSIEVTRQQAEYHVSGREPEVNYDSIYGKEASLNEAETASDGYRLLGMYTKHLIPEGEGDGNETYGAYSRQKLLRDLYKPDCKDSHANRHPELPYEKEKEREKEKKKPKSGGIYGLLLKSSIDAGHESAEIRYSGEDPGPGPSSVRGHVSPAAEWKGSAGAGSSSAQHSGDTRDRIESRVSSSEGNLSRIHDSIADSSGGRIGRNNYNGTVTATYRINAQHSQNNNSSISSSMASKVLAVPVHLRPKSAFGRSSIGEDPTRKTPLKRPIPNTELEGSTTPSMYEEHHTHRRHDSAPTSRSQTPRRYKAAGAGAGAGVQPGDANEGNEGGPRRGSLPVSNPATPSRKYSSSGRVSVAPSGNSGFTSDLVQHDSSSFTGKRGGISTGQSSHRNDSKGSGSNRVVGGVGGAPKVAAVFRLLENSIEQEIAATMQMESRNTAANVRDVSPLIGGPSEDDDESVLSHSSTLRAGHGPGEGSVRQSLILLKARKKSLTSQRSSRLSLTAQEHENAGDDDSLADTSLQGKRHSRRSNAFTDDSHSVVSEQSSSSSYPSRPPLPRTSLPFSGGATDGSSSLKSHLARSRIRADSPTGDSTQGRNRNQDQHTPAMHPCPHCGRSFGSESLSRHVQICVKIFSKKRQVFDSVQMRGIDENKWAIPRTGGQGKSSQRAQSTGGRAGDRAQTEDTPPKWKVQSEMFRESLKAARDTTDAIASGKPLPPSIRSVDPTLVPCPHCSRR